MSLLRRVAYLTFASSVIGQAKAFVSPIGSSSSVAVSSSRLSRETREPLRRWDVAERRSMGQGGGEEQQGEKEGDGSAIAEKKKDLGIIIASGFTGALAGWTVAHGLDLDIDLFGVVVGSVAGVGALTQEGRVGDSTLAVGEFVVAATKAFTNVAAESGVASKVAGSVGEELLDVISMTSSAVVKGYAENMPSPDEALEKELETARAKLKELSAKVDTMSATLSAAQAELKKRDTNAQLAAKSAATATQLKEAKVLLSAKDREIADMVAAAKKERGAFDRELAAAKMEAAKFKEAVGMHSDMVKDYEELSAALEALQGRFEENEARLQLVTKENNGLNAKIESEILKMEEERMAMRARISEMELSLSQAKTTLKEQRAALEKEFAEQSEELETRAAQAEAEAAAQEARAASLQKEITLMQEITEMEEDLLDSEMDEDDDDDGVLDELEDEMLNDFDDVEEAEPRVEGFSGGNGVSGGDHREELMKKTVKDLRELCKDKGVAVSGKKSDLVDRLLQSMGV